MNVTIINCTQEPEKLLIYTKETRLTLGKKLREELEMLSAEEISRRLEYIANTIPSSWEFVDYVFEITGVSRAFTHQFVRTRTGSYAQQTMRVLDVSGFDYVTGPSILECPKRTAVYNNAMATINTLYQELINLGAKIEDARGILPTNICTNIIAKFNLRTIAELARSRSGGRTQGEYQEVVQRMTAAVIERHPWTRPFVLPDRAQRIKRLEAIIDASCNETIRLEALKIIDQIKKGVI